MSRSYRPTVALVLATLAPGRADAQVPAALQEAMRARDRAAAERDVATYDRLTADDFVVVLEDGVRRTKADRIAHLEGLSPAAWVPAQQEQVKVYGNVAVQHFLSGDVWALLVWVKDSTGWRAVAGQDTRAKK